MIFDSPLIASLEPHVLSSPWGYEEIKYHTGKSDVVIYADCPGNNRVTIGYVVLGGIPVAKEVVESHNRRTQQDGV